MDEISQEVCMYLRVNVIFPFLFHSFFLQNLYDKNCSLLSSSIILLNDFLGIKSDILWCHFSFTVSENPPSGYLFFCP